MVTASVVVIGAGVMGASVAHHLALSGRHDVLLIDAGDRPGAGSTSRATGGFRAQYATPVNIRLSLLARDKLLRFRDETGVDPGYQPAGYLWLARSEQELDVLRAAQAVQHAEGLREAVTVAPDDIGRLCGAVSLDGIVGGAFCPTDGFIRPLDILRGYLEASARRGVRVEWGRVLTAVQRDGSGRIQRIDTTRGPIAMEALVNAAGPWAGEVARACGIDLPVVPLRRQVAVTEPCDRMSPSTPMTIFAGDGFHFRVRDGRVLLLWPTPGIAGAPFDARVDDDWIDAVRAKARQRVPPLANVEIDRVGSWAGLYEMSPDKHAILGSAPGCPNLFLINGSSGHGVMHAPALGQLLAEIMTGGRATTLDVAPLRPSRFAEGFLNPVSELL
jgi:sarcosine oxidase, subunit beta